MTTAPPLPIRDDATRRKAAAAVLAAPPGSVVVIRPERRSDEQNRLFHALCGELSKSVTHEGRMWTAAQWKEMLITSLWGLDMVASLKRDGGMIPIRRSSAALGVKAMSELIEFTYSVGAEIGHEWAAPPGTEELERTAA